MVGILFAAQYTVTYTAAITLAAYVYFLRNGES
jgi:hypothetical protein